MPDKTLKKFCRLSKYIEQIDKDLYAVFEDLCLTHLLKPARGTNGITLLYPTEKAYRQKIVNSAYTPNPEVAVNMIKALILQDYYPTPTSFEGTVVNLLNQKVEVEEVTEKHVTLQGGLKLEKDAKFMPMGYRENMTVYLVSGKGEMPLEGSPVKVEKTQKKTGGFFSSESSKSKLHTLLENSFAKELKKQDNVYAKKVCMQLELLFPKNAQEGNSKVDAKELVNYLGNSEFSDSYLLDQYCEKNMSDVFDVLLEALEKTSTGNNMGSKQFTYTDYINKKNEVVEMMRQKVGGSNADACLKRKDFTAETRMNNIQSPIEIRERVHMLYNDDRKKIGKDLFIVMSNLSQDLWMNEADAECSESQYRNYAYLASKVFNNPEDLVNQEFDIARDLTLYGNLLKSDVFMFSPLNPTDPSYPVPNSLPSPLDMNKYSLSGYVASLRRASSVTGGSPALNLLLRD